ncbi:MAG: hypothetical protein WCG22_05145, partial [Lentisphaerota bacterium]
ARSAFQLSVFSFSAFLFGGDAVTDPLRAAPFSFQFSAFQLFSSASQGTGLSAATLTRHS